MPRALLLGGTGQIGRAAARTFAEHGWDVVVASRSSEIRVDRNVPGELEAAVGDGVDVLVDIVAFTREHGEQLNALAGRVGSVVVISSASVYIDDDGRTLDEALLDGPLPATIVRPCAIHGPGSELPRELFFVKRVLDGRRKVVLVNN